MIIYKYLDEKGTLETIKNNSVLLSSPFDFNDPLDSIFYVDEKETEKAFKLLMNYQLFKKAYDILIVNNSNKPSLLGAVVKANIKIDAPIIKKTLRYKMKSYITNSYKYGLKIQKKNDYDIKQQFKDVMNVVMSALRNDVLVSCFGTSFDSVLMWSHYANKHKGVCLEFDVDDPDFRKVEYSEKLPVLRLYDSLEIILGHDFAGVEIDTNEKEYMFMLDPMFVKSNDWKYEGEVRCVYSKANPDSKIYEAKINEKPAKLLKMPKIKRIYIGCNADESFESKIKEISGDIPIIKMKTKDGEYGLEPSNE